MFKWSNIAKFIIVRLVLITLLAFPFSLFSQLITSKSQTPFSLVKNVLLGQGVEVSNVQYTGKSIAIGSFDGSKSNIGLSGGIIMTTGTVLGNAQGPIGPNNSSSATYENYAKGYPLLGQGTMDASILEFDFIPSSDTVKFRYVFASEEYPEYVGSQFNDKFAFFISGPGIVGNKNIAILPDGSNVAINNVNQVKNSQYYVDNTGGGSVQYDGFTSVLTASSAVRCGKKYHLIIVIADVNDRRLDSGVFLEAKSLSAKVKYEINSSLSQYIYPELDHMAEGCVSANIVVKQAGGKIANNDVNIPIKVSGSAIIGQDISNTIPSNLVLPKGQNQVSFSFQALADLVKEQTDSVTVEVFLLNDCDSLVSHAFTYYIENIDPIQAKLPDEEIHCKGKPIYLTPLISGGLPPYSILWSTNETTDSIQVLPSSAQAYSVTINDACLNNAVTVSNIVTIPQYKPLQIDKINDFTEVCPYKSTYVKANVHFGGGVYEYAWYQDSILISNNIEDSLKPPKTSKYTIKIKDVCDDTISTQFNYTILSPPLLTKLVGKELICFGDSTSIIETPTGGYGMYKYRWVDDLITTNLRWVKPISNSSYIVYVSDECKTFEVKDVINIHVQKPLADFKFSGNPITDEEINFINLSPEYPTYTWTYERGYSSYTRDVQHAFVDTGMYIVKLKVTDKDGCSYDTTKTIKIYYPVSVYIPNAFTPNGNLYNNDFFPVFTSIKSSKMYIFNRWGQLIFSSNDLDAKWNGTYEGVDCPIDVYIYKVKTISILDKEQEFVGHVSLIR